MGPILVKNAERMMTSATIARKGIQLEFADGKVGTIPYSVLPEIKERAGLAEIELPNPYELVLRTSSNQVLELTWDFARHYCDVEYRPRIEAVAQAGRESLGDGIRDLRLQAGLTQERLASRAKIGRVTLSRIESGEQSPRYETLVSIAKAIGVPVSDLLLSGHKPEATRERSR